MKIFKEFEGKTAFVTGAASGMGQAAAICLAVLAAGVAVAARNQRHWKRCRLYGKTAVRRFLLNVM